MIRFHFGHEDLVRTRFAISPLFDLTWSTDVLRDPAAHSLHLPWARAARRRLEGFDFELLDLLAIVVAARLRAGLRRAAPHDTAGRAR